jgi:hypothetical protein
MASSILINQLIVVGRNKNYTVNFNPGVNIIYGDSATGKSSILNLIDYLLGAKTFDLYPEIEAAARYAALDVTLNEDRYTIKRDIFDAAKPVEVFACDFDNIDKFAPKKYLPNFKENPKFPDAGFYSEFLLDALNLNNIKIKEAPSKQDSKLVRLSFRDLFKYCYVDQDDLGSKKFMSSDNFAVLTKNREVFKYIFNTLDSNISQLEGQISEKSQMRKKLDKTFATVADFLRESEFGTLLSFDSEVNKIDQEIETLNSQVEELNHRQIADTDVYSTIKSELAAISIARKALIQNMEEQQLKIERFARLKNDYLNDINKFKSALAASEVIGEIEQDFQLCPVCDNKLLVDSAKEKFDVSSDERMSHEINVLKKRARETEIIASETKKSWELNSLELKVLDQAEIEAIRLQEKNTKYLSSPYLVERDMYVARVGELVQKRKDITSRLKVRNQHHQLTQSIKSLDTRIEQLSKQLDELRKSAPEMGDVLSNLANHLKAYLTFVKIKSPTGVNYDQKTFLPELRNIEYAKLTSGGLRTIVGIGYLCSFMEEALTRTMSHPSFLMIDTVGKYLGKTKEQKYSTQGDEKEADKNEAVSDPDKYQNIFEYIIKIAEDYETKNSTCQFILVDNDVPDHIVDKLSGFIVAHFSSERINGLPVGFIDDAEST